MLTMQQALSEVKALSNTELQQRFSELASQSAELVVRMAAIVKTLEERGVSLEAVRETCGAYLNYLRRVASEQLSSAAVAKFLYKPMLMQCVSRLPVSDQEALATGRGVKLVERTASGTWTHRVLDPAMLNGEQLRLVFAVDHIRNEAEQIHKLQWEQTKNSRPGKEKIGNLKIDREKRGVWVGRTKTFISEADLVAALAELKRAATSAA